MAAEQPPRSRGRLWSRSCDVAGTVWHKLAVPALRHGRAHL